MDNQTLSSLNQNLEADYRARCPYCGVICFTLEDQDQHIVSHNIDKNLD